MFERILQVSVLTMVVVIVAFYVAANREMAAVSARTSDLFDEATAKLARNARLFDGEIATGGDPEARRAMHAALLSKAAMPGEAKRHNTRLHVGLLSFSVLADPDTPPITPIKLDVSLLKKTGVLFVSDTPTLWTLDGASINQRAKLAFEGIGSVAATNMHRGMLAGTRIQGLDAYNVTSPTELESNQRNFCKTMRVWSRFFGVDLSDITIFQLSLRSNTPILSVTDNNFTVADGDSRRVGTAKSRCRW